MEKKTLLAIVLSIGVLVIYYFVQNYFFSKPQNQQTDLVSAETSEDKTPGVLPVSENEQEGKSDDKLSPVEPSTDQPSAVINEQQDNLSKDSPQVLQFEAVDDDGLPDFYSGDFPVIETDIISVKFAKDGGDIISWKLKDHKDKGEDVEMIFSGLETVESHAFTVALGEKTITEKFKVTEYAAGKHIEFSKKFKITGYNKESENEQQYFTLKKRYEFKPDEYMVMLKVTLEGKGYVMAFKTDDDFAYSVSFGPQIGPSFEKLDGRSDYRYYKIYSKELSKDIATEKAVEEIDNPKWSAIEGKYFTFIAYPLANKFKLEFNFDNKTDAKLAEKPRMSIYRLWDEELKDTYYFYLGPKSQDELSRYNAANQNDFRLLDMYVSQIAKSQSWLSPVENVLKWLLVILQKGVINWGVAIILLTLLVKILFFPLTKKSSMATLRMQSLAPKVKELQEKYKDNRQKLNAEMAELYKKEGYNPLSGCLPMLLQIPIFFAMYSLFNSHFDLRGAMFIPGWIPDLSVPEFIVNFPEGFTIPWLGWTALRGLPFIYVGSQLLYGKVTQVPNQQSTTQTKIMLYVMPIVFFFILYNVPSGLLIYWIFSNILTLVQQIIIQKYMLPKMANKTTEPVNVIAPKKKKR